MFEIFQESRMNMMSWSMQAPAGLLKDFEGIM